LPGIQFPRGFALQDIDPESHLGLHEKRPIKVWAFYMAWLPLVDALRNQFAEPSKQVMDTILVSQSQMKNGFLGVGQ